MNLNNTKRLPLSVLSSYGQPDPRLLDESMEIELQNTHIKFVVLDDDPTGVQTVHDIHVYTDWNVSTLIQAFQENERLFYILTNSRGMTPDETTVIHKEITQNVQEAAKLTGIDYLFISRSDSTLRGHYPLETQILAYEEQKNDRITDGEILIPFFKEGGRFTLNNIHFVKEGDTLTPAAETEFAKDKSFGYTHSSIPEYIEEKTMGNYPASDVLCISLEQLRNMEIEEITQQLLSVHDFQKVCVNAIDYCDIKVFCIALYRAIARKKTFLFRTAAGFVKIVGGISDQPLLSKSQMLSEERQAANKLCGGLIVVGSHTAKTTAQLQELLKIDDVVPVEFHSDLILNGQEAFWQEVSRCVQEETQIIRSGKTAVCFTSRKLLSFPNDTEETALKRSMQISEGVWHLVADLPIAPSFLIAKGGITSSEIGTKALKVKRALVLGQICPGIPVWQTGSESLFPGIPYVIFPGNVGEASTLREAAEKLM